MKDLFLRIRTLGLKKLKDFFWRHDEHIRAVVFPTYMLICLALICYGCWIITPGLLFICIGITFGYLVLKWC